MNIQTIIDKFDKEFILDLSKINGGGEENLYLTLNYKKIKQFLKDYLTSMLDGIEMSIKEKKLGEDDEYDGYAIDCDSWNACRQEVISILNKLK